MKHKPVSNKRSQELLKLYQEDRQKENRFRIKADKSTHLSHKTEQIKPLSFGSLVFSLLLTFIIITVQLFISRFI
ncbi:hypothetical protein A2313_03460 [Candidatus Roizmanbacteria bacterium RIFOXYB2_FULL_41_10]|uniref:Uncharacterized protein n=1 Tax=Candidatus Roizmanbacteria bacterium RIFOXYA1_FULL_41_12 TaxID=1802082 RepID=A0A1F7KGS7_9BACT|nr:MAG: hypothetical protein A2262_01070 [Candidatus Roizmanbacteria bacterium RIFOXYA2_FULL_41_8]OGK67052.1 MAG: hypothetical protein A2209_03295 [Candidatus Roizmanbacteria bacterium RIFOXYA1_FULL_41_12]OGK71653.1 MAG: hypothetical protein A2403_04300 [Candidatus Roizmanbacteria bacterium RIFOXYC1_FULL_41_16]OGK72140.1 MAG: hypothetical protein A2313_03460 [Candidatus Roizmanbacteria bacterium RIFOXYB2_FULL_41_10]OGK75053.1 MAG: hypothetical protein A2575_03975 [Candidatus Roizmanbacteria bac